MFHATSLIDNGIRTRRSDGLIWKNKTFAVPSHPRSYKNAFRCLELNPQGESVFSGVAGVHANTEAQENFGKCRAARRKFRHGYNDLFNATVRRANLDETTPIAPFLLARACRDRKS